MRPPVARFATEPVSLKSRPPPMRSVETLPSLRGTEFQQPQATNAYDDEVNQLKALAFWWKATAEDRHWNYGRYFDAGALCIFLAETFIRDVERSPMGYEFLWPHASYDVQTAWYNCRLRVGFTSWPANGIRWKTSGNSCAAMTSATASGTATRRSSPHVVTAGTSSCFASLTRRKWAKTVTK
jgi:hypothetical protein